MTVGMWDSKSFSKTKFSQVFLHHTFTEINIGSMRCGYLALYHHYESSKKKMSSKTCKTVRVRKLT